MKTKNNNIVMNPQSVNTKGVMAELRALQGQKKQKEALKIQQQKAKVRKEIADRWNQVGQSGKYRKAALRESCKRIVADVEDTFFDGIFYKFDGRNKDKSIAVQKRILRRIVEKRHAQAVHKITKGREGKYSTQLVIASTSKCMEALQRHQHCA